MKLFVILCVLLGYFYTDQVDGNPLLPTPIESYENRDALWQGQVKMLLSKMSSLIDKINNSVIDIYTKDNEYFDKRITRINELIENNSSQDKSMNSNLSVADIPSFIVPIKNELSLCFNNVSKNIEQLKIKIEEDIEIKLADLQVHTSNSGWIYFMYELMYQTENSLRMELFESELMYIGCPGSIIPEESMNKIVYKKPVVETATNLQYENESALNNSIRAFVSEAEDIVKEANSTLVLAYTEDKKYIDFKTMKMNGRIETWSLNDENFKLTRECSEALNTANIQNIVRPVSKKNAFDCYSRFIEERQHDLKGFDEYKKNPLILATEMGIPTGEAEWKAFLDKRNYDLRYSRISLGTSAISYFNCIKKNVEHLKKLLNIEDGLISKACLHLV